MTNDELSKHLYDQSVRLLHRLAKGRVPRYFRMGKHRLIQTLLGLTPDQRAQLIIDLEGLIHEAAKTKPSGKRPAQPKPHKPPTQPKLPPTPKHRSTEHPQEPPITISAFLEGIGVPTSKTFTPDQWQEEAIDHLATSDVIVSVPTGSGKTYVAVEAMRRAMEADRTVIYTSPLKALSKITNPNVSRRRSISPLAASYSKFRRISVVMIRIGACGL